MAKIPFDIKFKPQIESGEYKVETRHGKPVRIICWDKKTGGRDSIVALVTGESGVNEKTIHYDCNGRCISCGICECNKDLFIVTQDPELTEFEQAVGDLIKEAVRNEVGDNAAVYAIGRGWTDRLLELANKELKKHEFAIFTREEFDAEIEEAKAEALKDLPRWKKCAPHSIYNTKLNLVDNGCGRYLMVDGYQIDIDLLLKRLPGYKED